MATRLSIPKTYSSMQKLNLNEPVSPRVPSYKSYRRYSAPLLRREPNYKNYRRYSHAVPGYQDHAFNSLAMSSAEGTTNETENDDEGGNSLSVSVIGLFILALCFIYAIFISVICTTVFRWISMAFSKLGRQRTLSKTELPKNSRTSVNQG